MMVEVFRNWKTIQRRLSRKKQRLFLFDFDGTLSEIVRTPSMARLGGVTKNLLRQLSKNEGVTVGIVSGRSLKDIKEKIGLEGLIYSGNHGLELSGRGLDFLHPSALFVKEKLRRILTRLQPLTDEIKGMMVENKGLTASLHFRNVAASDYDRLKRLKRQADNLSQRYGFEIRSGKKVYEVRPKIKCDKGSLVKWLDKKMKHPAIFFVGDDQTDEDAFRAIQNSGIGIRVGKVKESFASYYLKAQKDVPRLLERLVG